MKPPCGRRKSVAVLGKSILLLKGRMVPPWAELHPFKCIDFNRHRKVKLLRMAQSVGETHTFEV